MTLRPSDMLLLALGFSISLALVGPWTSASAHTPSDFYYGDSALAKWPSNHTEPYHIRNGFPSGSVARIQNAHASWNSSAGTTTNDPDFSYAGTTAQTGSFNNPCSITWSGFYYRTTSDVSPGALGVTNACRGGGRGTTTINFQIILSSEASWYTGTGTPGASQWDMQSIATHELGHATGFYGHFAETGVACPETTSRNTMCPGSDLRGTVRLRTLQSHDEHTFNDAYP